MRRRALLSTAATVSTLALSGCSMFDGSDQSVVTGYTFEKVPSSETPDDPTLTVVEEGTFTLTGTVTVTDGCTSIAVGSEPQFGDDGREVRTRIDTRDTGAEACTQQIRHLGYRLVVTYDGLPPEQVGVAQAGQNTTTATLDVSTSDS